MSLLLNELKERILTNYDPDDIIEALDISAEDLLDMFEDKLDEFRYKFEHLEED